MRQVRPRREHQDGDDDQPHQREAEPQLAAHLHRGVPFAASAGSDARERGVLDLDHLLQLVDVDFLDVLLARRPVALPQTDHAADDLDDALQQQERAGNRDDRLERVDRRAVRGHVAVLADHPRLLGVEVAGVGQRDHAGDEEHDVENEVDRRLRSRREKAVQDVAAHVPVLRQRVCAGHHEQRPVEHDHRVEGPRVRRVERVAREHLPAHLERQDDDQERERVTDERADLVDGEQHALHDVSVKGGAAMRPRKAKQPPGASRAAVRDLVKP